MTGSQNDPEQHEPAGRPGGDESPQERIDRLVREGRIVAETVEYALTIWRERLSHGVLLPNGEILTISVTDLYHVILDPRILRRPERIEALIEGVYEIRTADRERRVGISRWQEGQRALGGILVIDAGGNPRTTHVVDERRLIREQRRGMLIWRL